MTILITYGSNSGGTMSLAQDLATRFGQAGHQVTVQSAQDTQPSDLGKYDLVILGSCTWSGEVNGQTVGGQLQEHMAQLVEKLKGYNGQSRRFAVYALGDSSYDTFCQAADLLEKSVGDWHGQLIVPSLKIDGYFFNPDGSGQAITAWSKSIIDALASPAKA